jgi:hypothetical protein
MSMPTHRQKDTRDCKKSEHLLAGLRASGLPPLNTGVDGFAKFLNTVFLNFEYVEPGNVAVIITLRNVMIAEFRLCKLTVTIKLTARSVMGRTN